MKPIKSLAGVAAFAVALGIAGGAYAAKEVRVTIGVGPKHPVATDGWPTHVKSVEAETKGSVKYKLFVGGALLDIKATLNGVRDGVADAGLYAFTYWPAELPLGNLIGDFAMLGEDPQTMAAAATEFTLMHCPECLAEFNPYRMVYTGTYSTTPYRIISKGKVASLEDIKGKKLRTAGGAWVRWSQKVGAVSVSLPAPEMYEGISTGVIDGAIQTTAALQGYGLWDVAKDITLIPLGTYHALSLFGYNSGVWKDFTATERRAILNGAADGIAATVARYYEQDATVLKEATEKGVQVHQPGKDLAEATRAFALGDLDVIVAEAVEKRKITNARAIADKMIELMQKWEKLSAPVREDQAGYAALLKRELFDKIDVKTYGM